MQAMNISDRKYAGKKESTKSIVQAERLRKKKFNMNGKFGVNKYNNFFYVPNAQRKLCQHCGSQNYLTHVC